ncbi:MAG: HesA/MoeB/ThiF family protein [Candidatus Micrarchaeota archaeon]
MRINNVFTCQEKVIGSASVKLRKLSVAVIGAGGIGCNTLLLLGQLSVGKVTFVDPDVIEMCNLSRQPLYSEKDVGKLKVTVAKEKLSKQFPSTKFIAVNDILEETNSAKLLKKVDVVLDCTDNYAARRVINDFCQKNKIPWIYAGAIRDTCMVATFLPKRSNGFARFAPPVCEKSCSEEGVIATTTSFAATLQVQELINLIAGKPKLNGKLLHVNLSTLRFEIFSLKTSKNWVK